MAYIAYGMLHSEHLKILYMFYLKLRVQDHFKIIWLYHGNLRGPTPPPMPPHPPPQEIAPPELSLAFHQKAKVGSWKSSPLPVPRWQLETICFFLIFVPQMFFGENELENLTCRYFFQVDGSTTQVLCYLFFIAVYLTDVLCTDEPGLISMKSLWNWYPINGPLTV